MNSHPSPWRLIQRQNFTSVLDLAQFLNLSDEAIQQLDLSPHFPFNLPRRLAHKIKEDPLNNPIFLQYVPLKEERLRANLFELDPVQDRSFCKTTKLLQKYKGRALILCTSACAMHCRFCFRQNFPYETEVRGFDREIETISQDSSLSEIILSGGDPLSLSDQTLRYLLCALNQIPHVKRVRFHTRFPLGIPERIDDSFIEALQTFKKAIWFITHVNHPLECDETVWHYLSKIQRIGIPVLSQTVLLRRVNDNLTVLSELFRSLIDHQIMPYYLHQLDKVQGASHFEVSIDKGHQLIEQLREFLPGYAIPKYVQEIAGYPSKTPLTFASPAF